MQSVLRQADTPLAPALEKRTGLVLRGIICSGKRLSQDMYSCPPDVAHAVRLVKRWRVKIAPAISKWKKLSTQSPRCPHCDKLVRSFNSPMCAICHQPQSDTEASGSYLEKHHAIPLADGGDDDKSNFVLLCHECHTVWHKAHQGIQGGLRECIAVKAPKKEFWRHLRDFLGC